MPVQPSEMGLCEVPTCLSECFLRELIKDGCFNCKLEQCRHYVPLGYP